MITTLIKSICCVIFYYVVVMLSNMFFRFFYHDIYKKNYSNEINFVDLLFLLEGGCYVGKNYTKTALL